jgi:phenylpropionate dioxygenase-like ring-hydroxylating dioxygenase large terminal subunit
MREQPLKSWSAERYAKFLPVIEHLPENMRRRWTYFGVFPNVFFDVYPEWLDYFHVIPTGPGRVRIRARSFGFRDDSREMRATRWLSVRLNSRVQAEDEILTRSVQQGLEGSGYSRGILSDKEVVLAGFQDWIRERLPVAQLVSPPPRGSAAAQNAILAGR